VVTGRHTTRLRLYAWAFGLAVACATPVLGQPDPPIRITRDVPGDARQIAMSADAVTSWEEGGKRIMLLKGQVLIEHSVLLARCQQAVAVVDLDRYKATRVYHVEVYAEGEVEVQNNDEIKRGRQALLDLHTRGDLRARSARSKALLQPQPNDSLFQRGFATLTGKPLPGAVVGSNPKRSDNIQKDAGVVPAGGKTATPAEPNNGIRRTSTEEPAKKPTIVPVQAPAPPPVLPTPPLVAPRPEETAPAPRPLPGAAAPPPAFAPPDTPQQYSITPRTSAPFQYQIVNLPNGEQALVVTGGVILNVRNVDKVGVLDAEADRVVVWMKGKPASTFAQDITKPEGYKGRQIEFYMCGNVELRQTSIMAGPGMPAPPPGAVAVGPPSIFNPLSPEGAVTQLGPGGVPLPGQPGAFSRRNMRGGIVTRTLRCDELYYDVNRNVALAVNGDLEVQQPGFPEPLHLKGEEIYQLSPTVFEAVKAEVSASRLPSDPGLKVYFSTVTLEERKVARRNLFGGPVRDRVTGEPLTETQNIVTGRNVFIEVGDVPVFYTPYLSANANDPLGPLQGGTLGYNRIFGVQVGVTLDLFELLGIDKSPGSKWAGSVDYLSKRGPAVGTDYYYGGTDLFNIPSLYTGALRAWGIHDKGVDILGGGRGENDQHPDWRGRFLWQQIVSELPEGFSLQTKLALVSDQNVLEQFYKYEWDQAPNQETFAYLKQQQDNWAWTLLAQPHLRNWITETSWLPRAEGWWLGQSPFEIFTYNTHASVGYAELIPTKEVNFAVDSTDKRVNTGRFDLWQELSLPFQAGPFRLVPYGVLDLTYYTDDLTNNDTGRIYGGGGLRASIPFTRLYPDVESGFFNVNGINHKVVFGANYFAAGSTVAFSQLPQLDRLNDDATDQAIRDITPQQQFLNPSEGNFLANSPLFDPQRYAIRRLVDTRTDTLDDIQVLQTNVRQRWQTKRGYPGMQHIVDFMTLDLGASYFPAAERDNFGSHFAFLEYNWLWNIGDRTSLQSTGWVDPIDLPGGDGARVFTVGAFLDRPDRTNLFIGYRQIEPVHSRLVTAALSYVFSPKYSVSASTAYDFGTTQALSNALFFTRQGTDLQVSLGVTYNATQNNFGVMFEVLPIAASGRAGRSLVSALGAGALGR
jgi:hypothetical protein